MKVLITGANGFIGSYLAHFLLRRGYTVIATARNFHPGTRRLLQGAEQLELDVMDTEKLGRLSLQADVLVHTATANDIVSKNTAAGVALSAVGTKNMLDWAVKNRIERCMVFSTFQVYGTELTGTIDETSPLLVQNDYGMNHLFAEMYAEMYHRQGRIRAVAVRPSNVYGRLLTDSFNRWSLVPGCFCKEAVEKGTITLLSSGLQLRNFVNLENLSRGVAAILGHFPERFESYNLASSRCYTMREVATITAGVFSELTGKKPEVIIAGDKPDTTNQFQVDLSRLRAVGFTEDDRYTLQTEIAELIKYLQTNQTA